MVTKTMHEYLKDELRYRLNSVPRDVPKVEIGFAIEKKYSGERVIVHKRGTKVRVFSKAGKDLTRIFPTVVSGIGKLSKDDFILDCVVTLYKGKDQLDGELVSRYISSAMRGGEVNDNGIVFYAFDCPYYKQDISERSWKERKKVLHSLKFTLTSGFVREVGSIIVDDYDNAKKAIEMCASMSGSEGAVVKKVDGKYSNSSRDNLWIVLNGGKPNEEKSNKSR